MGSMKSHSPSDFAAALPAGLGTHHRAARFMQSNDAPVADMPAPLEAPVTYCAPSAGEPCISAETCKSQLGERTFNILREVMLQQQETFIEQLWDLHRLTRTQHRRAALLPVKASVSQQQVEPGAGFFSRTSQERIRIQTMHDISQLPTIPASLRRSFVASTPKDTPEPSLSPAEIARPSSEGISLSAQAHGNLEAKQAVPPTQNAQASCKGPLFAAGLNGQLAYQYPHLPASAQSEFQFADGPAGHPYAWGSASPNMPGSAFSTTLAMHGQAPVCANPNAQYLAGLQQHGGMGFAAVQQLPSRKESDVHGTASAADAQTNSPKEAQTQVDVSSLLGMMAPGLQPVPDMHQQWFQRNMNPMHATMPSAVLGLQKVMDVPVPEIKATNEKAVSQNSNSVWSTSSLFLPAALQVPGLAQQQLAVEAMPDCNKFAGLPSAMAMMMPEPLGTNDAPACVVPHQESPKPGTCHTDASAASILMSLKGS